MGYVVLYSDEAIEHLRALPTRMRAEIMDRLEQRLAHEPTAATRHRKRMDPDRRMYIAPWELRLGEARVYYAIEAIPEPTVIVVAVGIKKRNRLFIAGKEIAS